MYGLQCSIVRMSTCQKGIIIFSSPIVNQSRRFHLQDDSGIAMSTKNPIDVMQASVNAIARVATFREKISTWTFWCDAKCGVWMCRDSEAHQRTRAKRFRSCRIDRLRCSVSKIGQLPERRWMHISRTQHYRISDTGYWKHVPVFEFCFQSAGSFRIKSNRCMSHLYSSNQSW